MTRLDSFDSIGIYKHADFRWVKPSYIEHNVKFNYSKELVYLQEEVRNYKEGWDSYGAEVPDAQSIMCSIGFLSSFTNELRNLNTISDFPEFCIAPDGILGFEWDYAKNSHLFARMYSADKIEYTVTENNIKQLPKEVKSADFLEICKEKLQYNQAA
ncbi:MAG: hypothetical protein OXK80_02320 [Bdellovibrionales bacterium]|nr:hypothetical protein [Bdellovibrionales bacterium]